MSRQTQGSMLLVGVLSGGIAFTAFVVLLVVGGFTFSPALFLSALVGLGVAIFLFRAFHAPSDPAEDLAHSSAPTASTSAPQPAPAAPPAAAPSAPEPSSGDDAAAGAAPARLDGPRGGNADDLKKIKGVGPKLEALLHRMGFYHYDQIAGWTEAEVAWVDENLEGFKGRVSRDDWVAQAKTLASGGETEFSKRVDGGDVY